MNSSAETSLSWILIAVLMFVPISVGEIGEMPVFGWLKSSILGQTDCSFNCRLDKSHHFSGEFHFLLFYTLLSRLILYYIYTYIIYKLHYSPLQLFNHSNAFKSSCFDWVKYVWSRFDRQRFADYKSNHFSSPFLMVAFVPLDSGMDSW